jgi:hypothetical protein
MRYEMPKLVRYGKVAELTQGGSVQVQDVPFGVAPSTAYPAPGS